MTNSRRKFLLKITTGLGAAVTLSGFAGFDNSINNSLPNEESKYQDSGKKLGIAFVGLGKYSTEQLAPSKTGKRVKSS